MVIAATRAIPRSSPVSSRDKPCGPDRASTSVAPGGYSSVAAAAAHEPGPGTWSQASATPGRTAASSATSALPCG